MYQSQGGCPGPRSNISSVVNPGNGDQQKQTPGGENSNCILTVEYLLTIWSSGLITNCSFDVSNALYITKPPFGVMLAEVVLIFPELSNI